MKTQTFFIVKVLVKIIVIRELFQLDYFINFVTKKKYHINKTNLKYVSNTRPITKIADDIPINIL